MPEISMTQETLPRPTNTQCAAAILIVLVACLLSACQPGEETSLAPPKNVLIVFVDTLNRSALQTYSADAQPLPELDRFSREAAVYEEAVSTASWTLPAYASLLTGLFPHRHGVVHPNQRMREDLVALPSLFQQHGYETVAFTDAGFTARVHGFERGFDRYNEWIDPENDYAPAEIPRGGKSEEAVGEHLFDRGMAYLRSKAGQGESDPGFFLLLHTYSVHNYWQGQPWVTARLDENLSHADENYGPCLNVVDRCSEEHWDDLRELYDAGLRHLDDGFGTLLRTLAEAGLRESTLIVFLSDHGEGFAPEVGRIHHSGRLHEDLVRVPLMIAGPGVDPERIDMPVSLVDVFPTIFAHLDISPPKGLDGITIPLRSNGDIGVQPRPLFASEYHHYWKNGTRIILMEVPQEPVAIAVMKDSDWYIRDRWGEELYEMDSDSSQIDNVVQNSPETANFRALAEWPRFRILRAPLGQRTEASLEELRALGYLN